ncbi:carbamoyltransferase family protein [Taklimakanibacter lacteus]|uniref:carbamoyltransferase family protein n=1 Tax=Taklimakanibacter lacteus TaxID=2268456 RepID=UPI000E665B9F
MRIIGVSAYYHDSAAALIEDGVVRSAAQEERFTRKKHDAAFPQNALRYCLAQAGIALRDVDHVVFYEKPFVKFERLIETYVRNAPKGFASFRMALPLWVKEKLFQRRLLTEELRKIDDAFEASRLLFSEHHLSHAASAFYPSPFEDAVVLTLDGVGEWATTTVGIGQGRSLRIEKEIHFPHSLGLLYSAFTYYLGFKVNSGEYKVMGLAPYGEPRFKALILDKLLRLNEDGSFALDQDYFNYSTGLTMTNDRFAELFGEKLRSPEKDLLTQFHMDVAASVQAVTEEVVLRLTRHLARVHGSKNLCLAGGVALNCVANGHVLRDGKFENVWIQPAAGDAGGAVGAALAAYHLEFEKPRNVARRDGMKGAYLGPEYSADEIRSALTDAGAVFEEVSDSVLIDTAATALAEGKALGWFHGRMEFGPRSLGARSILGDARSPTMQKLLNLKVKYRESFRPFAPAVLREDVSQWFDLDCDSPYMLLVAPVAAERRREMSPEEQKLFGIDKLNVQRSSIPAVTHVDYSARVQTVHEDTNPRFHALISAFKDKTACPVLVNTSFNVRGEPIVCTPADAYRCFMGTEIEMLVCGNFVLHKANQPKNLQKDYSAQFELD